MAVLLKLRVLVFLSILILFLLTPLKFTLSASTSATNEEAEALVKWKTSCLNVSSSSSLDSWNLANVNNLCNWTGIVCSTTSTTSRPSVSEIKLDDSYVSGGTLDQFSFASFPHLTHLNLAECGLNGSIPRDIGLARALTVIDLSSNSFQGSIPSELGFCTNLNHLDLSFNSFSGVLPLSLSRLNKLSSWLDLSSNKLFGEVSPYLVSNWTRLTYLLMSGNRFTGKIPSEIGQLKRLDTLWLQENHFSGVIPPTIGNLTKLEDLNLSGNNLSGTIPVEIEKCKQLWTLDLSFNQISDLNSIPSSLSISLEVSYNNFSGELSSYLVSNWTRLTSLRMKGNRLIGKIPPEIGRLKQLTTLWLEENQFSGHIPPTIGNLTKLANLDLSGNNLSGPLPAEIGKCKQLWYLDLSRNQISGSIPPSALTNFNDLIVLDLSRNNLSGPIPSEIGKCKLLETLALNENQLSGPILPEIGNLQNLTFLWLNQNNLTGPIPPEVGNLKAVYQLDLSNNQLSGPIPQTFRNMSSLLFATLDFNLLQGMLPVLPLVMEEFSASHNMLTGQIHSSICNSGSSFSLLDLSYNSLEGEIPRCLGNLSRLSILMLQLNHFQGTVPSTIFTNGCDLNTLVLSDNQLEGPVSPSLVNCTQLEVLDLANNNISGTFPYWIDALPKLKVLVLRANRLHGTIATSNTKLPFPVLRVLDLSNNMFVGLLPFKYFQNFKAMMNIDPHDMNNLYMHSEMFGSYQDYSIRLMVKGSTREYERILTIFTAIDLSSNKFEGAVPDSIGTLHSLRNLNLSHNCLTGRIPALLGNLTLLESLDLSSNKLVGEIPQQLTALTSLEILNLSHNQLSGRIPQGPQFNTFQNDSYQGNLELCGSPLTKKCIEDEASSEPMSPAEQEVDDASFFDGFSWESVLMGYGVGTLLGLGLGIGSLVLLTGKPRWVARIVEEQSQKWRRSRKWPNQTT